MTESTWSQPITKIEANKVAVRGYRIDELMGRVSFAHVAYLALRGALPTAAQGRVMDALLVATVDHGATPPSVLAARTVASGGAALTTGIAAGIMTINKHHGGAIEGCMRVLLDAVARQREAETDTPTAAHALVTDYRAQKRRIPGYGHRIHSADPRTAKLLAITAENGIAGDYVAMAQAIQGALKTVLGKHLPLNVDGAIAAVLCEMDFPPEMGNGLFAIARTVGLTAHVFDEITAQRAMRRISPTAHTYSGPEERDI